MPMSDKEQVQLFQSWLKQYGSYILFALLAVACINFGWRYWQQHNSSSLEHATMVYGQMLTVQEQQKKDEVKLFGEKLIADYSSSPYASLAALMLAKNDIQAGDLKLAQEKLQFVIKKSPSKILRQLARIRAARVLLALQQPNQALELLAAVDDHCYAAEVSEVTGDALLQLGKGQEAENAYRKAQQLSADSINGTLSPQLPLLKIKLQQF